MGNKGCLTGISNHHTQDGIYGVLEGSFPFLLRTLPPPADRTQHFLFLCLVLLLQRQKPGGRSKDVNTELALTCGEKRNVRKMRQTNGREEKKRESTQGRAHRHLAAAPAQGVKDESRISGKGRGLGSCDRRQENVSQGRPIDCRQVGEMQG